MPRFAPAIILATMAALCLLAACPTRGGVNANAIMVLPAGALGMLAAIAAVIAWLA